MVQGSPLLWSVLRPTNTIDAPLTHILGGGCHIVSSIVADRGGEYIDNGLRKLCSPLIIQDAIPENLTLHRQWCSGDGSSIVSISIAHKDSYDFDCGLMMMHSACIIQLARLKIIDAPLTLIFGRQ